MNKKSDKKVNAKLSLEAVNFTCDYMNEFFWLETYKYFKYFSIIYLWNKYESIRSMKYYAKIFY